MQRSISLTKPEGKYVITLAGDITTHFTIDCECGDISGSWINSVDHSLEEQSRIYQPQPPHHKPKHTFHINAPYLEQRLAEEYTRNALEIGCRSCHHIFSFTKHTYDFLIKQIHEANRVREPEYHI